MAENSEHELSISEVQSIGDPDGLVGQVLDERYRIESCLDSGGLGRVYIAQQMPLNREVAIKVMREDIVDSPELRKRFEREARAMSSLSHPNITQISDYGIANGQPYLVMELLRGQNLARALAGGPLEEQRCVTIISEILRALGYAHSQGILHRDMKPANIFLQQLPDGVEHVKILDFGFAKFLNSSEDEEPDLTKPGTVIGSPSYIAPEILRAEEADARTDIYSLGAVAFELLAGRPPFVADTKLEILQKQLNAPVPRVDKIRSGLKQGKMWQHILEKALAKDRLDRFFGTDDMIEALHALQLKIKKPKVWGYVAFLAAFGLGIVAMLVLPKMLEEKNAPAKVTKIKAKKASKAVEPAAKNAPSDPWAEPLPGLQEYVERIGQGEMIEREELGPLYDLAKERPDDARIQLLLGHAFTNLGWKSDAIARYIRAYEIDSACRGDQRMMKELIEMAMDEEDGRAAEALQVIYGEEAISYMDIKLNDPAVSADQQIRWLQLKSRLERLLKRKLAKEG